MKNPEVKGRLLRGGRKGCEGEDVKDVKGRI